MNISPQRSDAIEGAEWWAVLPETEAALMMVLAWALEEAGLVDPDFLARCTTERVRFRPYLMDAADGVPKSPEWAEAICGAQAGDIRALVAHMATTRTLITVACRRRTPTG